MAVENFSTEFCGYQLSVLLHENATERIHSYNLVLKYLHFYSDYHSIPTELEIDGKSWNGRS